MVALLITIRDFENEARYKLPNVIRAAGKVVEEFCNVPIYGISGKDYENFPNEERRFGVRGYSKYHVIDTSTFDLKELKKDLDISLWDDK